MTTMRTPKHQRLALVYAVQGKAREICDISLSHFYESFPIKTNKQKLLLGSPG